MSRPDYDEVQRLVNRMREGSTEARRQLIEAHVGIAFKAAQNYEDDEALSDALVAIVEGVDTFRTDGRHPAAMPAFLKVCAKNAASHHCRVGGAPKRGGTRLKRCNINDAIRFLHSGRELPEYRDLELVDLMDQLLSLCDDDLEREMLYWRSQSFTYAEVAHRVGASTTFVAEAMGRLTIRFQVQEKLERSA